MSNEVYNQRLDFIQSVLQLNGLESESVTPVEFEENSPYPYNNFVYLVQLSLPTSAPRVLHSSDSRETQLGTVPLPANTKSFIIRLANSDIRTGLNNTNRVENEVAFISLARQALEKSRYGHIVPEIYTWAGRSTGQGFTMQKYMPGIAPDKVFCDLNLRSKSVVLEQMAEILALLQKFEVPKTVTKFGGLKFHTDGKIVSDQMSIYSFEPRETYKDFMRAIFNVKLQETDRNPIIQGWIKNGTRTRIENFLDFTLDKILNNFEEAKKVLVHSDLTTNNLLFNPDTLKVTALLDYDFSYIATVADEFALFSFANMSGGHLPGPLEDGTQSELRNAMLAGFSGVASVEEGSEVDWAMANEWNKALAQAGAARPCTIPYFKEIIDVYWLTDRISPFELDSPDMRKRMTVEQLQETMNRTEAQILQFLDLYDKTM